MFVLVAFLYVFVHSACGATLTVGGDGAQYDAWSLAKAIDAAHSGDTILLHDTVYVHERTATATPSVLLAVDKALVIRGAHKEEPARLVVQQPLALFSVGHSAVTLQDFIVERPAAAWAPEDVSLAPWGASYGYTGSGGTGTLHSLMVDNVDFRESAAKANIVMRPGSYMQVQVRRCHFASPDAKALEDAGLMTLHGASILMHQAVYVAFGARFVGLEISDNAFEHAGHAVEIVVAPGSDSTVNMARNTLHQSNFLMHTKAPVRGNPALNPKCTLTVANNTG
jgi:hypothetical protein